MQRKDVPELELLRAIRRRTDGGEWRQFPHELLAMPEKVVERKMEQLDRRGYIDWGVSLRTAWLTNKGRDRLAELEGG